MSTMYHKTTPKTANNPFLINSRHKAPGGIHTRPGTFSPQLVGSKNISPLNTSSGGKQIDNRMQQSFGLTTSSSAGNIPLLTFPQIANNEIAFLNSTPSNGVGIDADSSLAHSQKRRKLTNGVQSTTPVSTSSRGNKIGNGMLQPFGNSNLTSSSSSWEITHHLQRRSDAKLINPQKQKSSAMNDIIIDFENEDPSTNAVGNKNLHELMTQIRSILPRIEKMSENIEIINTNVTNLLVDVYAIKEKSVRKDVTKVRKPKDSDVLWKSSFVKTYGFNINGKFVKVDEFTGNNAKEQVAEIIKQQQDQGIWQCPNYNGISLKDEIQEYLKDVFEKIDQPSKVAYSVGQFLWHADHFLENHMTTIKPRGNKVNDAQRNEIPEEEKQIFTGVMLYCGGYLLDRYRDGEGKKLAQDKDRWLKWISNGREALNSRGKQDQKGENASSTVTKEMPIDFVPIFCRSEDYWEEMRQKQLDFEIVSQNNIDAQGNETNGDGEMTDDNDGRASNVTLENNEEEDILNIYEGNNQNKENPTNNSVATDTAWPEGDLMILQDIAMRRSATRTNSSKSGDGRERSVSRESDRLRQKAQHNYATANKFGYGKN